MAEQAELVETSETHRALAVVEPHPLMPAGEVLPADNPAQRIKSAVEIANALAPVIEQQALFKNISGRRYVLFEGWTILGALLPGTQVFPHTEWVRAIGPEEAPLGFEARVAARTIDGRTLSVAEARCMRSERNWQDRDDFAIESMAQTRAGGKALRMPLGFIMRLAGFEATPAEEMDAAEVRREAPAKTDDAFERGAAKAKVAAARKAAPAAPAGDAARITEAQARRIVAVARTAGEAHGAHGFHVVGSVLKECGLAAFPPKAKIDEALLHLTEVVEPSEYDEFVKMVEGWKPRSE